MSWVLTNDKPIYVQLMDELKLRIVSGYYKPGDKLDSVRDLAMEASVNPNTMQRALADLEQTGIIYTIRTSGRYVTENIDLIEKVKQCMADDIISDFISKMNSIGYSKENAIDILKKTQ